MEFMNLRSDCRGWVGTATLGHMGSARGFLTMFVRTGPIMSNVRSTQIAATGMLARLRAELLCLRYYAMISFELAVSASACS